MIARQVVPDAPPLDKVREDLAQRFSQISRSEPLLTVRLGTRPRGGGGEECFLLGTSVGPCDSRFEVSRSGLFDRKPAVRKRLRVVPDKTQPTLFFARGDAVWLREDTYRRSVCILTKGGSRHTDCPFPLFVVLLRNLMSALVLKVGCTDVNMGMKTYFCATHSRR